MEPGELPDATVAVSAIYLQQIERRYSHLRTWVNHLMGKVRTLGKENAMLRDLAHLQAKRIERLEEGILVRLPVAQWPVPRH